MLAERYQQMTIFECRKIYEDKLSRLPKDSSVHMSDDAHAHMHLRWFHPHHERSHKVILYFHGGSMCMGSRHSHTPFATHLCAQSRITCVLPDYRLAPEHPFPAAIEDACRAYEYLLSNGYTGNDIAICADSGGGLLAYNVACYARDNQLPLPACMALFAPAVCTDLVHQDDAYDDLDKRDPVLSLREMRRYSSAYLGGYTADDPRASPLYGDLSGLPPILSIVGSEEMMLDQVRQCHIKILKSGGKSQMVVEDGCFHAHYLLQNIIPEARTSLQLAVSFIQKHLNPGMSHAQETPS